MKAAVREKAVSLPDRFAGIPPEYVTDAFRAAVLAADKAKALREKHLAALDTAAEDVATALDREDLAAAALAAQELSALERLAPMLPPAQISPVVIAEALQLASARIDAEGVPPAPELQFHAEFAAYRSLTLGYQQAMDPPVALDSDLAASKALVALSAKREKVLQTVEAWRTALARPGVDSFAHLAAAAGTVALVREYRALHDVVADQVEKANLARQKAGLRWLPPSGVQTPALSKLAALTGGRT